MEINHLVVTRMFVSVLETMTQEEATEAIEVIVKEIEKKRPGIVRSTVERARYSADYFEEDYDNYVLWSLG